MKRGAGQTRAAIKKEIPAADEPDGPANLLRFFLGTAYTHESFNHGTHGTSRENPVYSSVSAAVKKIDVSGIVQGIFMDNYTQNGCFSDRKTEMRMNVFEASIGFL
jgi:hypothetical protein